MPQTIHNMNEFDLAEQLVGRRIVRIDAIHSKIHLHNGTVLTFEDTSMDHAWFGSAIHEGELVNSEITEVRLRDAISPPPGYSQFELAVMSAGTTVCTIEVDGEKLEDDGAGNHLFSISLVVDNSATHERTAA